MDYTTDSHLKHKTINQIYIIGIPRLKRIMIGEIPYADCLCEICFDILNSEGKIKWKEEKIHLSVPIKPVYFLTIFPKILYNCIIQQIKDYEQPNR